MDRTRRSTWGTLLIVMAAPACGDDGGDDGGDVLPDNAYCAPVADWEPAWADYEVAVVALVNQRRATGATCGGQDRPAVGAMKMDAALRCAARAHSRDMRDRGYFAHNSPEGESPGQRAGKAGYDGSWRGENIAAGYPTPEAVVQGWMDSPGHCNNIMNGGANEIGIGYVGHDGGGGGGYSSYWTMKTGFRSADG